MAYSGYKLKQYHSWKNLRFRDRANISPEWLGFEKYAEDTYDKPSPRHFMKRLDASKPWGPGNWEWKEPTLEKTHKNTQLAEYLRERRRQDPEYDRNNRYLRKYGITYSLYKEMLDKQEGLCAVSGRPETTMQQGDPRQLALDHDHKTKKIRQLLRNNCNSILGHAGDSPELLVKLIIYLDKHSYDHGAIIDAALIQLQEARRKGHDIEELKWIRYVQERQVHKGDSKMRLYEPAIDAESRHNEGVKNFPNPLARQIKKLDPWCLYVLRTTGQRVLIKEYSVDGKKLSLKVSVYPEYNDNNPMQNRDVFGIDPKDLELCDPAPYRGLRNPSAL